MTLDDAMAVYPHLTSRGFFDEYSGKPSKRELERIEARPGFAERRAALRVEADTVERCAAWLRKHIEPRSRLQATNGEPANVYRNFGGAISDGGFRAAALIAGFDIETRGRIHWGTFKWSAKSWGRAHAVVWDQRDAAEDIRVVPMPGSHTMPGDNFIETRARAREHADWRGAHR